MGSVDYRNSDRVPAPVGPYSHLAVVARGHDLAFFSGQLGTTADGQLAGSDAGSQTRQVFENLSVLLDELDATPADIIQIRSFIVGAANLDASRIVRTEIFNTWYPNGRYPTHTLIVVAGLAAPGYLVEVDAVVSL